MAFAVSKANSTKNEVETNAKETGKVAGKEQGKPESKPTGKVLTDQTKVPPAPNADAGKSTEPKADAQVYSDEQKQFIAMTQDQLWAFFGGANTRGVVSKAIRHLNAVGFTRSKIADLTGKRYQHVRNVLVEDARMAKNNEPK